MSTTAFPFLDELIPSACEPPASANAFVVAGVAQHDASTANVLAFLLDPNARHGFGSTFVDALVAELDGAVTSAGTRFVAADATGSVGWRTIVTRSSETPPRAIVTLDDELRDVSIAVDCSQTATDGGSTASASGRTTELSVRLRVRAPSEPDPENVRTVTFDDLFDAASDALYDVGLLADQRSLELYAQFRETMSERIALATIDHEQRRIDDLWSVIADRQDQVLDFLAAIDVVNDALAARCARLRRVIDERLDHLGIEHATWIAPAGDHAAGRIRGERVLTRLGVEVDSGLVELLAGWLPRTGSFGYAVTAHHRRARPPRPWDHAAFGLPIDADEDAVADRFVDLVQRWIGGGRPD